MTDERHPDQVRYGKRILCAEYSRIVGYIRPLASWADHKQLEFHERQVYTVPSNEQLEEETDGCPCS